MLNNMSASSFFTYMISRCQFHNSPLTNRVEYISNKTQPFNTLNGFAATAYLVWYDQWLTVANISKL